MSDAPNHTPRIIRPETIPATVAKISVNRAAVSAFPPTLTAHVLTVYVLAPLHVDRSSHFYLTKNNTLESVPHGLSLIHI